MAITSMNRLSWVLTNRPRNCYLQVIAYFPTSKETLDGYIKAHHKHLLHYLDECGHRHDCRFWEGQLFNRLLHVCIHTSTITFSESTARAFRVLRLRPSGYCRRFRAQLRQSVHSSHSCYKMADGLSVCREPDKSNG